MIKEELIEAGKVSWADYKEFFSFAFGGMGGIILIIVLHIIINLCTLSVSLFLAFSLTKKFTSDEALTADEQKSRNLTYNIVLISIISFALLSSFVGKFLSNKIFMGINRSLHDRITRRVLQTGIVFFEENTQGRILNRFSKDVGTMDNLVFTVLEMADVSVNFFPSKLNQPFYVLIVLGQMHNHSLNCDLREPMAYHSRSYINLLPLQNQKTMSISDSGPYQAQVCSHVPG